MQKTVYILKYLNGMYVKRDDSTGPYSSGGYPSPVEDLELATQWPSAENAAKYGEHFKKEFDPEIYPLVITYEEQPGISSPFVWKQCDHNCPETELSTARDSRHYLDCPVWEKVLKQARVTNTP